MGYIFCFFFSTKIDHLYEIVSGLAIFCVLFYVLAILTYVYIIEYTLNIRTTHADELPMRTHVLYEPPKTSPKKKEKLTKTISFDLP